MSRLNRLRFRDGRDVQLDIDPNPNESESNDVAKKVYRKMG